MKRLFSGHKLFWFTTVAVSFYTALSLVLPTAILIEVFNGVFLGLVISVSVVFFPLFIRAISAKQFDRVSQLTIGILCTWASMILSRAASVAMHSESAFSGVVAASRSPAVALAAYIAVVGGILHITAPGMVDTQMVYNRRLLFLAFILGAGIAVWAIFFQGRYGL